MTTGIKPGDAGDRRQSLRDMHGADHHQANGGNLHGEEIVDAVARNRPALAGAQRRLDLLGERIVDDPLGDDKSLLAAVEFGHQHAGAARGARGVQRLQIFKLHPSTRST